MLIFVASFFPRCHAHHGKTMHCACTCQNQGRSASVGSRDTSQGRWEWPVAVIWLPDFVARLVRQVRLIPIQSVHASDDITLLRQLSWYHSYHRQSFSLHLQANSRYSKPRVLSKFLVSQAQPHQIEQKLNFFFFLIRLKL